MALDGTRALPLQPPIFQPLVLRSCFHPAQALEQSHLPPQTHTLVLYSRTDLLHQDSVLDSSSNYVKIRSFVSLWKTVTDISYSCWTHYCYSLLAQLHWQNGPARLKAAADVRIPPAWSFAITIQPSFSDMHISQHLGKRFIGHSLGTLLCWVGSWVREN